MLRLDTQKLIKARGGLSLREAEEKTGVSHSWIYRLEQGAESHQSDRFPLRTLLKLARGYGVNSFLDLCVDLEQTEVSALRRSLSAQGKPKN